MCKFKKDKITYSKLQFRITYDDGKNKSSLYPLYAYKYQFRNDAVAYWIRQATDNIWNYQNVGLKPMRS